ncbi:T9SS type A sorting domain-containing protein [Hymenobacter sp. BT186]|uniref:phospholipase D n=1 Tax=Hymenobacter telluris TaxID=2816474 RepID=A0A939EUD7_9BACT|nr:phospholipase D-like domain-containing protein [Hymenobacter telluris]MBO0358004.1 T9SS type A sorting domain-containing protein [Hymenobacter telluris]MBW3374031.1 T9SS type A sorting domain-containing protein [Hymenobacter norwichensis]
MKTFTLSALFFGVFAAQPVLAQTPVSIAAARTAGVGATVTVRGVVTNGAELGVIRYLQDGTAGLAAYSTSATGFDALVPGDSIQISGTLKNFNGLLEMDPVTSVSVLATGRTIRPAATVAAGSVSSVFAEAYEGQVVRITGNTRLTTASGSPFYTFSGNTNYLLNGTTGAIVRTNTASTGPTGVVGKIAPNGNFALTGIMSQFSSSGTGGYQLLPRLYADFELGTTPNVIGAPSATAISTAGFTVSFPTQNPGDTRLEYGLTPTTLTQQVNNTTVGTQHTASITGLQPGTVYYVKVSSSNASGRSELAPVPMITASLSSGKMRTYFNNQVNITRALPGNNAVYLPNGTIADTLARYINLAQQTLDIAIYNWNSPVILTAVNAAKARGVVVRVVYEADNTNVSIAGMDATIPRVGRATQTAIMHNKFVVIDANSTDPNRPWVWTGSTNWTPAQLVSDRNSAIAVQDQSLARVYTMEFNEMFGNGTAGVFGAAKTDNTPHYLSIAGKAVESWFSPTDNVQERLIATIQTANNDLHVATMLITRPEIATAIRDQVLAASIAACSEVLLDDASDSAPAVPTTLRTALGNRVMFDAIPGTMHHKYVLVDAGASQSDPTVFVGSHNWSAAANTDNDENTLIVHDARVVNQYYQEYYQRITEQNVAGVSPCNLVLANRQASVQRSSVQVYPNPTHGSFALRLEASKARTATVTLRDVTGRVVLAQTRPLHGQEVTVDASTLRAGLYMVQIVTPEATQVSRVVVE